MFTYWFTFVAFGLIGGLGGWAVVKVFDLYKELDELKARVAFLEKGV